MFKRRGRIILEGLLIVAAMALPIAVKAADSYEEYVEEAWTTDGEYTGKTYYHRSELEDYTLFNGIDVSWWQGVGGRHSTESAIDWEKMHEAGIEFAIVRVASRDTADGSIYEDTCADSHIRGALKNNINVGLYVFSQALTKAEAEEEARYVLGLMRKYGWDVSLPIVIDRENGSYKRMTAGKLTMEAETDICVAFSKVIKKAGYTPMVYANANWISKYCDLERLEKNGCRIWLARWNERSDQPVDKLTYEDIASIDYEFWQYSDSGKVPGCSDRLDLDFWYLDTEIKTKGLEMISGTANSVSLAWNPVEYVEDYEVYRCDGELEEYTKIGSTPDTDYVDTGLEPGKPYRYKLRCRWKIGGRDYYGEFSKELEAVTLPEQVTELAVGDQTESSVSLSWKEAAGAEGYRIYQYDPDMGKYVKLMDVTDGSVECVVDELDAAEEYSFRVSAFLRYDGTVVLGKRSEACDTVTYPPQMEELSVQPLSTNSLELEWSKAARVSGYQVYRLNAETGEYEKLADVKGRNTLTYTDDGLTAAKKYSYQVRAYLHYDGTDYFGGFSPESGGVTKPAKVKNLKLTTEGASITLTWNKVARASGYQICRWDEESGKFVKIAKVKGNQTFSYTDGDLEKGTTYRYKVRAYKSYEGTKYGGSYSTAMELTAK